MRQWVKSELYTLDNSLYSAKVPTESGRKLKITLGLENVHNPLRKKSANPEDWFQGSVAVETENNPEYLKPGRWMMVQLPVVSDEGLEFVAIKKEDFGLYPSPRQAPSESEWEIVTPAEQASPQPISTSALYSSGNPCPDPRCWMCHPELALPLGMSQEFD